MRAPSRACSFSGQMCRCLCVMAACGVVLAAALYVPARPAMAQPAGGAYLTGSEPWTESDCAGDVPVVVGSDAAAQSDIYSAVTLAGALGTDCIVLAGPRGADMAPAQQGRLDAAATGGWIVGGTAAVPAGKTAGRAMTRLAGDDRWATAHLAGSHARTAGDPAATAAPVPRTPTAVPDDMQQPGLHLAGAGPWIASDCAGDVPVVVGSDAAAQSDIYSAVTLAGALGTDCIVLAGPRNGGMAASQRTRLRSAATGGFVVGGAAAVPAAKTAGRAMTRLAGDDRWATAHLVGRRASGDVTVGTSTADEDVSTSPRYTSLSASSRFTCGVRTSGEVDCWGNGTPIYFSLGGEPVLRANGWSDVVGAEPDGEFTTVSAGELHACALRKSGAAVCWGYWLSGGFQIGTTYDSAQLQPPDHDNAFTAIAAGSDFSCGLRPSGEVRCWGTQTQMDLKGTRDGKFSAIVAGGTLVCGLRLSGEAECWGGDGNAVHRSPPSGKFAELSLSGGSGCGLRPTGAVVCWGLWSSYDDEKASSPQGKFIAVDAGRNHACGIRTTGKAVCWGHQSHGKASPPNEKLLAVAAGDVHTCGLRLSGEAVCWGGEDTLPPPVGKYSAVDFRFDYGCGIRTSGQMACWGAIDQRRVPEGVFTDVVIADSDLVCGLQPSGSAICWHHRSQSYFDPPPSRQGPFSDIAAANGYVCGVYRGTGEITCWGHQLWDQYPNSDLPPHHASPPSGPFVTVEVARVGSDSTFACGLRASGEVACWWLYLTPKQIRDLEGNIRDVKSDFESIYFPTPGEKFSSISLGVGVFCGVRLGGEAECWPKPEATIGPELFGDWWASQYAAMTPPEGRFTETLAGHSVVCGLRPTGEAECWGITKDRLCLAAYQRAGGKECWGTSSSSAPGIRDLPFLQTPPGPFVALAGRDNVFCGFRPSGTIDCWGSGLREENQRLIQVPH